MKKLIYIILAVFMICGNLQLVEANENDEQTVDGVTVVTEDTYQPVDENISDNMENAAMGSGIEQSVPMILSTRSVATPYWDLSSDNKLFYDANGTLMFGGPSKMILDVSEHQGKIDWDKVKAAGVDGVILRVGWGYLGEDAQFKRNLSECNRLGIPYGIYLYSYAYNANFAYAEAEGTAQMLKGLDLSNLKYPIYYDIENFTPWEDTNGAIRKPPTTVKGYEEIITTYINRMNQLGYQGKVHVYSYRYYLQTVLNSSKILPYVSWIAAYTNELGFNNSYYDGGYGWQYTSSANVSGISGNVDMSAFSSKTIIVTNPQSVTLSKTSLSLPQGRTQKVTAKVNPSQFVSQSVSWTSDNPSVASVDEDGTIHANKMGSAVITAYATNNVKATVKVTVTAPIVSLTATKTVYKGQTVALNGTASNGGTLKWKSSDTSVATVDAKGNVKGVKAGTAYITATTGNDSAQCKVTVKNPTITLDKSSVTIYKGQTNTLKATTSYSTKVTWKSSNTSIVTVDANGNIKGVKAGTAYITASINGASKKCKITVKNPTVKLNKSSVTIYAGQTSTLKATPSYSTKVTWRSSNKAIATVDANGKIKGLKAGTVYITASINGASTKCKVTVKNPTITLNKKSATVYKGTKYTLKATTSYSTKVTWKSSNTKIATVDSKGVVTPKKAGKVTITATAYGKKASCTLTVKNPSLTVSKTQITISKNKSYTVTAKTTPNKKVTWSSKNSAIATVSSTGKITGKKKGTTYIYAKANGLTKTIKVTVR